jgi:hypothetical protein
VKHKSRPLPVSQPPRALHQVSWAHMAIQGQGTEEGMADSHGKWGTAMSSVDVWRVSVVGEAGEADGRNSPLACTLGASLRRLRRGRGQENRSYEWG